MHAGTRRVCADAQGAGDDALVPKVQEADPGGVQGPVVAAAARAPTPSFVVEGQTTISHLKVTSYIT